MEFIYGWAKVIGPRSALESSVKEKSVRKTLFAVTAALTVAAVTGLAQDVRYNFDRNTDFTKYRTYKWVQIKDSGQLNQLADRQVKDAIDAQLAAKGIVKTDQDDASLYIAYQAALGQEKRFNSFSTDMGGWGYGAGWRGWGGPSMGTTTTTSETIHVGQIALDMYDPTTKTLVWRGEASKALDARAKPEKQQKNLNKAVAKLLKKYPPEKK